MLNAELMQWARSVFEFSLMWCEPGQKWLISTLESKSVIETHHPELILICSSQFETLFTKSLDEGSNQIDWTGVDLLKIAETFGYMKAEEWKLIDLHLIGIHIPRAKSKEHWPNLDSEFFSLFLVPSHSEGISN
jgi:hypothetical protein